MLPTLQPGFNQARQIARERRAILDSQKLDKCVVEVVGGWGSMGVGLGRAIVM